MVLRTRLIDPHPLSHFPHLPWQQAGWNREKLPGGVRTCRARDPTNNTWMAIIIFMLDGILSSPSRFSLPAREKSPPDIISLHVKS